LRLHWFQLQVLLQTLQLSIHCLHVLQCKSHCLHIAGQRQQLHARLLLLLLLDISSGCSRCC
jgi:hypothetical protein